MRVKEPLKRESGINFGQTDNSLPGTAHRSIPSTAALIAALSDRGGILHRFHSPDFH
jgi:hypothetical protein